MVGNAQKMGDSETKATKYFEIIFENSHYGGEMLLKEIVRHHSSENGFSFVALGNGRFQISNQVVEQMDKKPWLADVIMSLKRNNGQNVVRFRKDDSGGHHVLAKIAEDSKGMEGDFNIHYVGDYGRKHKKNSYVVSGEVLKILQEGSPVRFRVVSEQEDNSALIHTSF